LVAHYQSASAVPRESAQEVERLQSFSSVKLHMNWPLFVAVARMSAPQFAQLNDAFCTALPSDDLDAGNSNKHQRKIFPNCVLLLV
jgi:hypothetical protein